MDYLTRDRCVDCRRERPSSPATLVHRPRCRQCAGSRGFGAPRDLAAASPSAV